MSLSIIRTAVNLHLRAAMKIRDEMGEGTIVETVSRINSYRRVSFLDERRGRRERARLACVILYAVSIASLKIVSNSHRETLFPAFAAVF